MANDSDLAAADAMISTAWGHSVDELYDFLREGRANDPALVAVLRIRTALVMDDSDMAVQQARLHRMTRPGNVPLFHESQQLEAASTDWIAARAGSQARVHAIRSVVDAFPEGYLADGIARALGKEVTPRVDAARARSSSVPAGDHAVGHEALPVVASSSARDPARASRR
ncbi:hypothetical protein AB0J38_02355 [Streptomyces sp. NPDC050095]|uniref:hypothetical protein n=1 Tax=unclassified Streptomyces TaxID=2593676 RepID=UPI003414371A